MAEETRWLDDAERDVWRTFITMTSALTDSLDRQLQRDAKMPYTYYEILVVLSEAPRRELRMSELAGLRGSSRSRLSHAVSRLEEAGWVERRECPTDKRGQLAVLTDAGFAALAAAAPGHVTAVRESLFDRLTAEQVRVLGEISAAVLGGLDPDMLLPGNHPPDPARGCGGGHVAEPPHTPEVGRPEVGADT
ncbi:MarR family transcriptional regulator [Actinokineospora sp. PR83]|uniref:MarR family winged helix-turn-helix transcriptional regulator n=1 Tax=Actinokineospora sp. PR83 TaxID=2884908 RepID=UPI001F20632F|nr:MarR family transcriptional regulator [Actinokineospora sp. PR83]MCG8919220.1 MarR family transcriptional regulator [Actinokineospora sp. PR83]